MNGRYEDNVIEWVFSRGRTLRLWETLTRAWAQIPETSPAWPLDQLEEDPNGHEVEDFLTFAEEHTPEEYRWALHRGLTSSDLTESALMAQVVDGVWVIQNRCAVLRRWLRGLPPEIQSVAYTHGVPAKVMDVSHRLAAWFDLLDRIPLPGDFYGRMRGPTGELGWHNSEKSALAKVALLPYPGFITQTLPRHVWVEALEYPVRVVEACAKIAVDLRLLISLGHYSLQAGTTSSAMPHKVNPSRLERVDACRTQAQALYVAVRSAGPLWLERDLTHSLVDRCNIEDVFHLAAQAIKDLSAVLPLLEPEEPESYAPSSYEDTFRLQTEGMPRSEARRQVRGF